MRKNKQQSFDAKNAEDYEAITQRIKDALGALETDARKPTREALAKLAECSVGTLRNRKWPMTELKAIQLKRLGAKHQKPQTPLDERTVRSLEKRLALSREELRLEFNKRHAAEEKAASLKRALATQANAIQELRKRLASAQSGPPNNNVVPLAGRKTA